MATLGRRLWPAANPMCWVLLGCLARHGDTSSNKLKKKKKRYPVKLEFQMLMNNFLVYSKYCMGQLTLKFFLLFIYNSSLIGHPLFAKSDHPGQTSTAQGPTQSLDPGGSKCGFLCLSPHLHRSPQCCP